ncbi:hypothetical protein NIES2135_66450 (plasmid) [Leptolyngbya boryana NIES-2135]|jgi:hypothetical protein|uniref:Uncharacterized protein n=1 Tax=Leptolyngbya boryana NIES-2135 TaxID=1973484 RepID=A0A1Z4JT02_LEPBY|nr:MULTISPECIES: hypothetical protein [Leptolyngbya]BAY59768.1 hypothetical protein NIES2135_66450 [Leptolyngbya boryana NIES-2135]MBD2370579.1 hypothetical protein [Leptolyngbya sp. FACHB-161]MBD2377037.1 hypothetical protein [Leptolyngbya sp. FACHB-238]MBD2401405.1 hypothetical protein [Leptolyngbya sp. FACHB-239]MBD2407956.1 hypothetical protein [Leptolyngbya sp. FACHB-402]
MATLPPVLFNPIEKIQFTELLQTLDPNYLPYILSTGCGIDSLSRLIKYIENLIGVHAVVGGELIETCRLMQSIYLHHTSHPKMRSVANLILLQANIRNHKYLLKGIKKN